MDQIVIDELDQIGFFVPYRSQQGKEMLLRRAARGRADCPCASAGGASGHVVVLRVWHSNLLPNYGAVTAAVKRGNGSVATGVQGASTIEAFGTMGLAAEAKEPLNKSRVAATEAFRDEMREATRRPWQAPRASGATADRPRSWQLSPVPSGLRAGHSSALLRGLRIGQAIRCALSWQMRPSI